ncbi:MAG: PAS domain S-box protein [Bacteroidales bacterium]|nr:PAS domain S-box protein [Bacteroidales bacterium]
MKNKQLNLLILEDNPVDAELIVTALEKEGFIINSTRVETEDDFKKALVKNPDLILAGCNLLPFSCNTALQIRNRLMADIPFIIVSDAINEKIAGECIKSGATDYVYKDRLAHLWYVVEKAIKRTDNDERKQAVKTLTESEEKYRFLVERIDEGIGNLDEKENFIFANRAAAKIFGYSKEELTGKNLKEFTTPEEFKKILKQTSIRKTGEISRYDLTIIRKDGEKRIISVSSNPVIDDSGKYKGGFGIFHDITERKQKEKLEHFQHELAVKCSENIELDEMFTYCLDAAINISEMDCGGIYSVDEDTGSLNLVCHKGLPDNFIKSVLKFEKNTKNARLVTAGKPIYGKHKEIGIQLNENQKTENLLAVAVIPVKYEGKVIACLNISSHTLNKVSVFARNALETTASQIGNTIAAIRVKEALQQSEKKYRKLAETVSDVIFTLDLEGKFTYFSPNFEKITGYSVVQFIGKPFTEIIAPEYLELTVNSFRKGLDSKKTQTFEIEFLLKDGKRLPLEINPSSLYNAEGQIIGRLGVARDISKRKEADIKLKESEEQFRTMVEHANDMIWTLDTQGRFTFFNRQAEIITERKFKDWNEKKYTPLIHPDDVETVNTAFIKTLSGESQQYTVRILKENNKVLILSVNTAPVYKKDKISGTVSFGRDITEHKKAEEKLKQKNTELNSFINNIPDMAWLKDKDSNFIVANKAFGDAVGMDTQYLISQTCEVCFGKEAAENFKKDDRKVIKSKKQIILEESIKDAQGNTIYLETIKSPIFTESGNVTGTVGVARDITERKKTEEALIQSEKNYREFFNNATDAIYIQDREGHFLDINQGAIDMYGYPKEFFIGKTPEFLSAPGKNDMKKIIGFVEDAFNDKPCQYDFWGIRKNGEVFPKIVRSKKGIYFNKDVVITFASDITERKKAEQALKHKLLVLSQPAGNTKDLKLIDVIDIDILQQLQDGFAESYEVASQIFDEKGNPITKQSNFSDFCKIIRNTKKGLEKCEISDANLISKTKKGLSVISSCKNFKELSDGAVPIFIGDKQVAVWSFRQKLTAELSEDEVRSYAVKIGTDADKLIKASRKLKIGTEQQFSKAISFLEIIVSDISLLGLQNIQQAREITKRIEAEENTKHYIKRLTVMSETAAAFNKCNTLKEVYKLLGQKIYELTDNSYVIVTSSDRENGAISIKEYFGFEKHIKSVLDILGKDPRKMSFLPDITEKKEKLVAAGKLKLIPNGLHSLSLGKLPEKACKIVEILLNISHIYSMGISFGKIAQGGIVILLKKDEIIRYKATIEAITKQASDVIHRKFAEEALRESEEKYRQLAETAKDVILLLDLEGNVKYVNNEGIRFTGYSEKELLQKNIRELLPSDQIHDLNERFAKRKKGEKSSFMYEAEFINKKGKNISIEVKTTLIIEQNKPAGVLVIARDITERKQTEKAMKEYKKDYQSLFESAGDAIFLINIDDTYKDVSKQACKLLGYSKDEFLKMQIQDNIIPEFHNDTKDKKKQLLAGGKVAPYEKIFLTKEKEKIPVEINISLVTDINNKPKYITSIVRDITERKKAEQSLIENEKQLQELNATKDIFFSIIAHDLKNPIAAVLGFSKLLLKNLKEYDIQKQKKFIRIIFQSVQNIDKLLENLLLWSRSQRGVLDFNPEKGNLYLLYTKTIKLLKLPAEKKSITIKNLIPEDIIVKADKNMISTVIRNLISNAIKYTHRGGEIIIKAQEIKEDNKQRHIKIAVKDSGIGIASDIQAKLFTITENVSTEGTDNETGTGLGLILCKEFVEKHGGKIWVESEEGKGSEFIFTIPMIL